MKHGIYYVAIAVPIVIAGILLYDHTQAIQFMQPTVPANQAIQFMQPTVPANQAIQFMQPTVPANQTTLYGCGHDLAGNFFYHYYGACSGGTPTIPSQAKGIPQDAIRGLVDYDEKLYADIVRGGHCPQGSCSFSVPESCQYDSNGEFIPHLSEDQKKVLLDLNSTYGFDICPFKKNSKT